MAETRKFEIHVKGGFSERKGIKKFSDIVQVDSLNERTRNKIYNVLIDLYAVNIEDLKNKLTRYIYCEILSLTYDDIPRGAYSIYFAEVYKKIKTIIISGTYDEVFTFIEGIVKGMFLEGYYNLKNKFVNKINRIFEEENVNYHIIDNMVTDIVNSSEIEAVEETLNSSYEVIQRHFSKAIELLYHAKDYNNSIKESISSVETICQIIVKNDKATLGDALKKIKNDIHPAMKSAFEKLYGYTSDANGIRHSNGLGEGNSTFSEAKYMLISCSAFVNYLKENFENK